MGKLEDTATVTARIRRALVSAGMEIVTDHPSEELPVNTLWVRNQGADAGLSVIKLTVNMQTFMDARREALAAASTVRQLDGTPPETGEPSASDAVAEAEATVEAEPAALDVADPEAPIDEDGAEVRPTAKRRRGRRGQAGAED